MARLINLATFLMTRRRLFLLMPVWLFTAGASEPRLVPDVSQRQIDIQYSFKGEELLLFGAIVYPDGRIPATPPQIVVVLKGPEQSILMREKEKIAGIWINANSMRFRSAPTYYAIASSKPLKELTDEKTAAIYELGVNNIQLSPASFTDANEISRFENGLTDLQARRGLFVERTGSLELTDGVLYRARLPLSARVLVGDYTAETFLIQNGRVVAAAVKDIVVRKSGFEGFIATAAEKSSILYGLCAVAMAIGMGWIAGQIGKRV